ncbi:MAG: tRNA (adenosine(37)-N6)-threonylcarbamoyltransferase complex ATPase subunit type 1 TsaE [Deltaproteobacteria bacterium RIFCSPLOWO2_02_FULL_47_10]|nr:MAG: tRNA (adenosine(37)-N6)-threonylcarbamoyltransferase complex ATPase subunit type 1 TsaE [Deltaproteobacteria bacterium RIFCSPLOWO2_02_FULL_47_10]
MQITTKSVAETQKFAAALAKKLKRGDIIALTGELGAGKTCLVQGLANGLHIKKKYYVNSPTFTILNIYEGGRYSVYHFDWYRLTSSGAAIDVGLEEYFDGDGISVIEWAEKFPDLLPKRTIWIKMEAVTKTKRKITYAI